MKIENSESWHQEQIFKWARSQQIKIPELQLLHASLNGVKLSPALAGKMKRQGMRSGVPDIFLPVARGMYAGLFIELKKASGGVVSAAQRKFLAALESEGYKAVICRGYVETIQTIKEYLSGR